MSRQRSSRSTVRACGRVACVAVLVLVSCRRGPDLLPVALPDLSQMDGPVQQQARDRHAALTRALDAGASGADLGRAFGEFGMLMHAAEYYDAALPAYLNAQVLMPDEPRWPYFLAHVYRNLGDSARAAEYFQRVLQLRPGDLPTSVWLGRTYLDRGEPEKAEPLLLQAQSAAPGTTAVLAALGQAALARRDYQRAVTLLEQALDSNPGAASVHSPLALAYRGLGDTERAEAHLKQWRNTEISFPDPWKEELDTTLESGLSYEVRGVRALETRDFQKAADLFRKGLALTPAAATLGRSLRHKLGTALFLSGDVRAAIEAFRETVRLAPKGGLDEPSAKANYSLGVIEASSGRDAAAIDRFTAALGYNPSYLEARMALADILRRTGRVAASLEQYRDVLRLNPRSADARIGYAIGLVRLRRYAEARAWLEESVRVQPDHPELSHVLARLLAAAPDPRARDGARALDIVRRLLETTDKTTPLGETLAMALAETGDFGGAAAVQRDVIDAARRAGLHDAARRMEANLGRYERGQPCRTPWDDDDPVHFPGPPVSEELAALTS